MNAYAMLYAGKEYGGQGLSNLKQLKIKVDRVHEVHSEATQ